MYADGILLDDTVSFPQCLTFGCLCVRRGGGGGIYLFLCIIAF